MTKKVVIIGGGLAGLATAYQLLKTDGCRVKIIEKESNVGGLAISVSKNDVVSDLGPHRIYSQFKVVDEFLEEIVGDALIDVERKSKMFLDGKFVKYPPSIATLLAQLDFSEICKFAAGFLKKRASAIFKHQEDISYDGWMRLAYGDALYERILLDYSAKAWKMDPRELSAELAKVRLGGGKSILSFAKGLLGLCGKRNPLAVKRFKYVRGGIGQLCNLLSEKIRYMGGEIVLNCEVNKLKLRDNNAIESIISENHNESLVIDGDYFVFSIPLTRLGSLLLAKRPGQTFEMINSSFRFISMICTFVVLDRERYSDDSWMYFPQKNIIFNRVYESKNFDESLCPPNKTVLCFEVTDFQTGDLWAMTDEEITKRVIADCERIGMFSKSDVIDSFSHRISHAYPIYDLIFDVKLKKMWQYLSGFNNVMTIGRQGLYNHNNMDHSIYMGIKAADFITSNPQSCQQWYSIIPEFAHFRIFD